MSLALCTLAAQAAEDRRARDDWTRQCLARAKR